MKTIVIISDIQYPFQSTRSVQGVLDFIRETQPDEVVHIGDLMDYPQAGRWSKDTAMEFQGSVFKDSEKCVRDFIAPLREIYKGPIGVHEGNHDCVSEETRAVTKRGLVHHEDLTTSDQVLSVDDEGNSVWLPVKKVFRYNHSGTMHRIYNEGVSALVTGNHRVIGKDKRYTRWVEHFAADLPKERVMAYTAGKGHNKDYDISSEMLRLAVWAWTDSHRTPSGDWVLYQSGSKAQRVRDLLSDAGIPYLEKERHRDTREICGRTLKTHPQTSYEFRLGKVEELDYLVPDRLRLSPWVWDLSASQVRTLVEEWVFTDGSVIRSGPSRVIYCSKDSLREDLQTVLTASGVRCTSNEYRPGHWRLNLTETRQLSGIYGAKEESYNGTVWCVEVSNGRFFVELDGKLHLTGNSRPRMYLTKYSPALAESGAFNLDVLLEFDKYGVELLPDFYNIAPGWVSTHGHVGGIRLSQVAGATALGAARKFGKSVVMGHTHRQAVSSYSSGYDQRVDKTLTGFEVGHLMDMKKASYLKKGTANWQQGFGILYVDGKHVQPVAVPIKSNRFIVNGVSYRA